MNNLLDLEKNKNIICIDFFFNQESLPNVGK